MAGYAGNEIVQRLPQDRPCRAAEVGVNTGTTSDVLMARVPGLTLYMVDWWQPADPDSDYAQTRDSCSKADATYFQKAKRIAMARTEFAGERRIVLHGDCCAMAEHVPDESLDLVFLDADHSYLGTWDAIMAWARKVRGGGWLGGHDYEPETLPAGERRYGVNEAVCGLMSALNSAGAGAYALELGADSTWWVRFPAGGAG